MTLEEARATVALGPRFERAMQALNDAMANARSRADDSCHEGPPEPESYPEESQEAHDRSDDDIFSDY